MGESGIRWILVKCYNETRYNRSNKEVSKDTLDKACTLYTNTNRLSSCEFLCDNVTE